MKDDREFFEHTLPSPDRLIGKIFRLIFLASLLTAGPLAAIWAWPSGVTDIPFAELTISKLLQIAYSGACLWFFWKWWYNVILK